MAIFTILIGLALILIMVITLIVGRAQQKNAITRFSRKFGLDVPEGMEPAIRASVMARHIGAVIGTVITEVIAVTLLLIFPGFQILAIWWCLFAAYLAGAGIGSATAILLAERKRDQAVVRVARTSAVTVNDYVPPFQSGFTRIAVVLAVVAFAGDCWLSASDSSDYLSIVSGVLVVLSVALVVVYEIVSRRLVSRGVMAGTQLELAWDDGLRSYALSNLNSMVALLGLYSFIAYDTLLVDNPSAHVLSQSTFSIYTALLPIGGTLAVLGLVFLMTRIRSRQHFLRRLWPSLAVQVDTNVSGAYTGMMG